jgi:DNA-binding NtrC family response regulator
MTERPPEPSGYGRLWAPLDSSTVVAGGHKGVVLVVDDEPAIRLLCKVNLELDGYEVREAGTLDEARRHLEGPVDVVLLDMHIGRDRGEVLLEELIERQIPVAVVTGSTDLATAGARADATLGKPFTIEELEDTVARLAARASPRL